MERLKKDSGKTLINHLTSRVTAKTSTISLQVMTTRHNRIFGPVYRSYNNSAFKKEAQGCVLTSDRVIITHQISKK